MYETGAPVPRGHHGSSLRWFAGLLIVALTAIAAALTVHLVSIRF
jgi:hypothetical protein